MFRKTFNKKLISTMVAVATVFSLMVTPAFAAADSGVAITGGNLSHDMRNGQCPIKMPIHAVTK